MIGYTDLPLVNTKDTMDKAILVLSEKNLGSVIVIAAKSRHNFGAYLALGLTINLSLYVFINIGMAVGLVPVIGIPLPFISYGGSSLFSFTILIAIFVKMDSDRSSLLK